MSQSSLWWLQCCHMANHPVLGSSLIYEKSCKQLKKWKGCFKPPSGLLFLKKRPMSDRVKIERKEKTKRNLTWGQNGDKIVSSINPPQIWLLLIYSSHRFKAHTSPQTCQEPGAHLSIQCTQVPDQFNFKSTFFLMFFF